MIINMFASFPAFFLTQKSWLCFQNFISGIKSSDGVMKGVGESPSFVSTIINHKTLSYENFS